MMIAGQRDGMAGLAAASGARVFRIHSLGLAKLAVIAGTAVALVGLYIGTKHFFSNEDFVTEQIRVFDVDIGESCLNRAEPPPVFEAREGDRIVLKVTSLYSGDLYLHGLETETNIKSGAQTTVTFTVAHAGRYFLHLHGGDEEHAHVELAVLEVAPRSSP